MDPDIYSPLRLTTQIKLNKEQKDIFNNLAHELRVIIKHVSYLDSIIARGGYILDVLSGVEPIDIDLFYSLKGVSACRCDDLKEEISKLNLRLINAKKVDLGHILPGEIFIPPVEKVVGPFSHHIDIPSMVCLDSDGNIWGNEKSFYHIRNKIHEINYLPWIMHYHFPYSPDNPYYRFFYTSYSRLSVRGLRMIHSKKYKSVGPNFRNHLINWPPILTEVEGNSQYFKAIKEYITEKCSGMTLKDYEIVLKVARVRNKKEILKHLEKYL